MLSLLLTAAVALCLLAVWLALEPLAKACAPHIPANFRSRRAFDLAHSLHLPPSLRMAVMPIMAGADGDRKSVV